MQNEFFLFLTFKPNNVFFVLHKQFFLKDDKNKIQYKQNKMLLSMSCGLFKEKGIKRYTIIAFESNFKYFLQKIKTKKIYFKNLNIIINTSLPKNHKEKLKTTFKLKKYFKILLKHLKQENLKLNIINNQKISFNGCKLPKLQRKKMRKQNLNWYKLFKN